MKEFLIIAVVLVGLFFVPRLLRRRNPKVEPVSKAASVKAGNAGLLRLAVLLSGIWMAVAFVLLNPLAGNYIPFIGAGVLPVVLGWGIRWVVLGFKK